MFLSCIFHDNCCGVKFDYLWSFLVKKLIGDIKYVCVKILVAKFLCEILPVMWSIFLWKTIHVFCNHTFCDVKYFYFLLSKYSLRSGKGPLGGSRWKLLELTSVTRFLAYCTHPHKWRISVACEKNLHWGKKMYPAHSWVSSVHYHELCKA